VRTLVLPEPIVEFLARCSREVRGHVPWPRMWREPVRRRGPVARANVAISCWRVGLPATKERCKPACQSASSRCSRVWRGFWKAGLPARSVREAGRQGASSLLVPRPTHGLCGVRVGRCRSAPRARSSRFELSRPLPTAIAEAVVSSSISPPRRSRSCSPSSMSADERATIGWDVDVRHRARARPVSS